MSPGLSQKASTALGQMGIASPSKVKAVTLATGAAAVLGIIAGLAPRKEHTLQHLAFGGSVTALGIAALLFTFGD